MAKRIIVTFPDIGEGVVEGEIIEWLKKEGDDLAQDEPVVVVMTDKATVELPATQPGKLAKCCVPVGQLAIKDKPLYEIEISADDPVSGSPVKEGERVKAEATALIKAPKSIESQVVKNKDNANKVQALPKVRKMAHEMGIDIHLLRGSGREGRIIPKDLVQLGVKPENKLIADEPLPQPGDQEVPLSGIRLLMAKKMTESNARIPHFAYFESVDVTRLMQLRSQMKPLAEDDGIHLTYMPFFIRALSLTMTEFQLCNSSYDASSNKLFIHQQQHIGIAVAAKYGLIVPVLKDVQAMSLQDLIHAYDILIVKARDNKLLPADMKGGTVTISNFGTAGHAQWAMPIINYPEVAILALARIQPQAVVKNGDVVVCEMVNLSWSFDHRVIDGDLAVKISDRYCQFIRNPATLL